MDKAQNNELDEQLKQLAISAQQHPPLTKQRQLALTQLVNGILQSGRLCRPYRGQFQGVYEEIYDEAVQQLLLYVCQNIDRYDSERSSVVGWVNALLERRFFKNAIPEILDKPGVQKMSISELDNLAPPQEPPDLSAMLKECIESDPENMFKEEHVENHPAANFQALAKRRIAGQSWKDISAEFGLKIPTVSSFYYRCLNKFGYYIKEYCRHYAI